MSVLSPIVQHIKDVTGHQLNNPKTASISGGGINDAYHLSDDTHS